MSKIHVYHHNDHDGIVAAGILYNFLYEIEDFEFRMANYQEELNFDHINFENGDIVYFLDYSFSNKKNLEEFKKLLDRRIDKKSVIWIDHHKTSIKVFDEYDVYGIVDTSLCGAAWTYLWVKMLLAEFQLTTEPELYS